MATGRHISSRVPGRSTAGSGWARKAAYLAAAEDRPVAMPDLVRATEREYRKLGRLTVEAEFGEYLGLLEA